jgi:S1-C subfamily serine protease
MGATMIQGIVQTLAARVRRSTMLRCSSTQEHATSLCPTRAPFGLRQALRLAASVVVTALLAGSLAAGSVRAELDEEGIDQVARSTVLIVALVLVIEDGIPVAEHASVPLGSGTLVSDDGLILTNSHVIDLTMLRNDLEDEENAKGVDLEIENEFVIHVVDGANDDPDPDYSATLMVDRPATDLAVLRIIGDENGRALRTAVGDSRTPLPLDVQDQVEIQDSVHVFGYPVFGHETFEEIGAKAIDVVQSRVRSVDWGPGIGNVGLIHLDATVSRGSSGGPVVDEDGHLVGILTEARVGTGGSEALAIPVDRARAVLASAGWIDPSSTPTASSTPIQELATATATSTQQPATPTQGPATSTAWGQVRTFDRADEVPAQESEETSRQIRDGGLVITINEPTHSNWLTLSRPTGGRDFGFVVDLTSFSGDGGVFLELRNDAGDRLWRFVVDPVRQQWWAQRHRAEPSEYYDWVDATSFAQLVPEGIRQLELRVRNGVPTLLINDIDVVEPAGVTMPAMNESFLVTFGANAQTPPVTAVFDRVELYELP